MYRLGDANIVLFSKNAKKIFDFLSDIIVKVADETKVERRKPSNLNLKRKPRGKGRKPKGRRLRR